MSEPLSHEPIQQGIEHGPHPTLEMTGQYGPFTPGEETAHQLLQARSAIADAKVLGQISDEQVLQNDRSITEALHATYRNDFETRDKRKNDQSEAAREARVEQAMRRHRQSEETSNE